jgi:hypothetical protein
MKRYTAVFEWPDGEEPTVNKGDGWLGGALCTVIFADAIHKKCKWLSCDGDTWETSCGNFYEFYEGGPKENCFEHCPYCGSELEEANQ